MPHLALKGARLPFNTRVVQSSPLNHGELVSNGASENIILGKNELEYLINWAPLL